MDGYNIHGDRFLKKRKRERIKKKKSSFIKLAIFVSVALLSVCRSLHIFFFFAHSFLLLAHICIPIRTGKAVNFIPPIFAITNSSDRHKGYIMQTFFRVSHQ